MLKIRKCLSGASFSNLARETITGGKVVPAQSSLDTLERLPKYQKSPPRTHNPRKGQPSGIDQHDQNNQYHHLDDRKQTLLVGFGKEPRINEADIREIDNQVWRIADRSIHEEAG